MIKLRKGVESLMQKIKSTFIQGYGRLKSESTIDVEGTGVTANNIILATGSFARSLPSLPIDGAGLITSDHAIALTELPKRILIVGAGAIGCEFGYIMRALGVDVTMVEFLDRALPMEDLDISMEFQKALDRSKIKLHTRASVESVEKGETGMIAHVKPRDAGGQFTIETDKVLVSVGRGPSTKECGLEELGIPLEKGFIKVDSMQRTGVGNVRAIGDAVGASCSRTKRMPRGFSRSRISRDVMSKPLIMKMSPGQPIPRHEVASVGLDEHQARERFNRNIKVSKYPFAGISKAVIINESDGFVKLISASDKKRLVGAHAIGPSATDIIATAATAIASGLTAEHFAHIVQAHPTLSECWLEAGHGLLEGAINY